MSNSNINITPEFGKTNALKSYMMMSLQELPTNATDIMKQIQKLLAAYPSAKPLEASLDKIDEALKLGNNDLKQFYKDQLTGTRADIIFNIIMLASAWMQVDACGEPISSYELGRTIDSLAIYGTLEWCGHQLGTLTKDDNKEHIAEAFVLFWKYQGVLCEEVIARKECRK